MLYVEVEMHFLHVKHVCEREREREKEREREIERERESVCACVCVCVSMRKSIRDSEREKVCTYLQASASSAGGVQIGLLCQ